MNTIKCPACGKELAIEFVTTHDISFLGLSFRAERCLRASGIDTVQDLTNCSVSRLRGITGFGECSYREVHRKLSHAGLGIRGNVGIADAAIKEALGITDTEPRHD